MKKWNIETNKSPLKKVPSFAKTRFIDEVVKGSPAESLGIQRGDKLLSINGEAAFSADIVNLLANSKRVDYAVFLTHENAILTIKTEALPLGVVSSPSSEAVLYEYSTVMGKDHEGFMTLWEREEHSLLSQAALAAKKLVNSKGRSLISKVMRKEAQHPIADLMLNIANAEVGGSVAAYQGIRDFQNQYSHQYTMDLSALAKFYLLQNAQQRGDIDNSDVKDYEQALKAILNDLQDSQRVAKIARTHGISQALETKQELGSQSLTTNVSVEFLEGGKGSTTLAAIINAIPEGKLLPICFLGAYRGNGPYNDCLKAYISMYPHIQDTLAPMVVLTDVKDKPKNRPYWFQSEKLSLKKKIPLTIVYESNGTFISDLSLRASPEFAVLDHTGTIVSRNSLDDDVAYWKLLDNLATGAFACKGK